MRSTHATGNNLEAKSLFLAEVPLNQNNHTGIIAGRYYFPDFAQLKGRRIVGLEFLEGGTDIPTQQQPDRYNAGRTWWTPTLSTFLTLFNDTKTGNDGEIIIQNAPILLFALNNRNAKKITSLDAVINWRSSFIDVIAGGNLNPPNIYCNFTVYYL